MNQSLSETYERVCKGFFYFFLFSNFVLQETCQATRPYGNVLEEVDLKFLMKALIGEMRRVLRAEMEQVHEQVDWVKNACVE